MKKLITFSPQARPGHPDECYLRARVMLAGREIAMSTGHVLYRADWNPTLSCAAPRSINSRGISGAMINRDLRAISAGISELYDDCDARGVTPTREQIAARIRAVVRGEPEGEARPLDDVFSEYIREESVLRAWSDAMLKKYATLRHLLADYSPRLHLGDLRTEFLTGFTQWLLTTRGYRNETVATVLKNLRAFSRWARRKQYLRTTDVEDFAPRLRRVSRREVVYLDFAELRRIMDLRIPITRRALAEARQFFLFMCFTGLRYSDARALRWEDVRDGALHVVSKKTGTSVVIELNTYSERILAERQGQPTPLPPILSQKLNERIKELAYLAGIDQPIRSVYYSGARRVEEVRPKYAALGAHTGRRTFVCLALQLGIPAATVMEWTGHSSYAAMRPYVGASGRVRASAMRRFDQLGDEAE